MHVDEIRVRNPGAELALNFHRGEDRAEPKRAVEEAAATAGYPGDRPGHLAASAGASGMRHVLDFVTAPARPVPQLPGEERVGGLIRRQVRRDVKDAHQPAYL